MCLWLLQGGEGSWSLRSRSALLRLLSLLLRTLAPLILSRLPRETVGSGVAGAYHREEVFATFFVKILKIVLDFVCTFWYNIVIG